MAGLGGPLISDAKGKPFNERFAATRWDAIAREAGIDPALQRRDLRRTAVVRLTEAGCEVPRIAAITLHSFANVHQILETYLVRTYNMAQAAIVKLESYTAAVRKAQQERRANAPDPT